MRAVLLIALLVVTGCGSASSGTSESDADQDGSGLPQTNVLYDAPSAPTPGGTLVVGLSAETNSWSPVQGQWGAQGYQVARAIFDPLAAYDASGAVKPYLAEAITPNDDFTQWTITAREGVSFHDGTPVDATAIARNLDAQRSSSLTGQAFAPLERVEVAGDRTVVVDMNTPWSSFAGYLTSQLGFIAAPSMLDDPDGGSRPVGSGPFSFKSWKRDAELVLEKNDDYWQPGRPLLDSVTFRVIVEELSRFQSLLSGDVDMLQILQPEQMVDLANRARSGESQFLIDRRGVSAEIVLPLNSSAPPFDDVDARRAVAYAVDKQSMSRGLFLDVFAPADSGLSQSSNGRAADSNYPSFDPEQARQLAQQYRDSHDESISFTLQVPGGDPQILQIAQYVQQSLADVDIDMRISTVDQASLLAAAFTGNFEAIGFSLFGQPSYESVNLFLDSRNAPPPGQFRLNLSGLSDPQIDQALGDLRRTADESEIARIDQVIDRRLGQLVPYLYLVHTVGAVGAINTLHGFEDMTLPDGSPALPVDGSVIWLTSVWTEP